MPPWGDLSEFRGRQLFVNAHYRLANGSRFTPYLGVGGGLTLTDYRFYLGLLRKSIAEGYLEVFGGSRQNPEASPEWQRRAAGSLSQLDATVSETGIGFQVLGGIEVGYSERVPFDLRARWVHVPEVDIDQRWLTNSQPRARVLGWDDPVRVANQLLEAGIHRGHGRAAVSSVGGSVRRGREVVGPDLPLR